MQLPGEAYWAALLEHWPSSIGVPAVQGALTKQGPIQNLEAFLMDPGHNNIVANVDKLSLERIADLSAKA